jgi:hypothetical protein
MPYAYVLKKVAKDRAGQANLFLSLQPSAFSLQPSALSPQP